MIFSSSICLRHAVIQFKIVHRLHWSKTRLSKIKPDLDPTCDRCRQDPATLLHMFWTCPKLYTYWVNIFETFSKTFGERIEPSPFIALFGVAPENIIINKRMNTVLAFGSLLARRLILFKWKDPTPPTHTHWIRESMGQLKLEKIRHTIKGSTEKFYNIWQPFLTVIADMDAAKVVM